MKIFNMTIQNSETGKTKPWIRDAHKDETTIEFDGNHHKF